MTDRPTIQDVRRYVDNELEPEAARALEQRLEHDDDLRRQVDLERRLRDRVLRVMSQQAAGAPAGLEQRVRSALGASSAAPARDVAGRVDARTTAPARKSIFQGPNKANVFAVAASLAIVAGAILFGIYGRSIDDVPTGPGRADVISDAAVFVSDEHGVCVINGARQDMKLVYRTMDDAVTQLTAHLGVTGLPALDLAALGYVFLGGGRCMVPGADRSGHFMFRRETPVDDGRYPMVSVFIVPDDGQFDRPGPLSLDPDFWRECSSPESERRVLAGSNGEVTFFVVCCLEEAMPDVAALVRRQIGRP